MAEAKVEVFTSITCPYCPGAIKVVRELAKERKDFKIAETGIYTKEGRKRAERLEIRSVPTLIITSPSYPDRIGYTGVPSKQKLNKMLNIVLGKEDWVEEEGFFSRLAKKLKLTR